jgi:Na+/H+ antiporter NhaA
VIALFYGGSVAWEMLVVSALLSTLLVLLARARVQAIWPYAVVGVLLWIAVQSSGIHATVAGVVIGLALPTTPNRPARDVLDDLDVAIASLRRESDRQGVVPEHAVAAIERHVEAVQSPLTRMLHGLHGIVAFGIVPLFALANAGVSLSGASQITSSVTLGVFFGLCVGKPIGVLGSTWLATRLGLAPRPAGASWSQLLAASLMAGIGFTMSLLVGNLGLGGARGLEDQAKLGILAASLISAVLGLFVLRRFSPKSGQQDLDVPVVLDVPRFARGYGVRPCNVAGFLLDRSIAELDVRRRHAVTVIGMWLAGGPSATRTLEPVDADRPLRAGDVLLVAGADAAVDDFLARVAANGEQSPPKAAEQAAET